jgi:hypothetical protein
MVMIFAMVTAAKQGHNDGTQNGQQNQVDHSEPDFDGVDDLQIMESTLSVNAVDYHTHAVSAAVLSSARGN